MVEASITMIVFPFTVITHSLGDTMNWTKIGHWLSIFLDVALIILVVMDALDMTSMFTKALLVMFLIGSAYRSAVELSSTSK
ncbi:hypothetical protein [Vibrio phage BUCT194]|uniref:Uncharacterized protein n=1 Tax=Vibrio phage BUCT194 TaxID=2859072 RepID=A0AAE9BP26_9CAUD|nr:hypothetical protein PP741_gp088 [Vibrio phage BUCT194]UAW01137.1 hypothetical protein [Vibrio phage BUCT194]